MRLLLSFMVSAMFLGTSAQAFTLVCEITPVTDKGGADIAPNIPKRVLESWLPPKQVFLIDLNEKTVVDKRYKTKATMDVLTEKRIRWRFIREAKDSSKTNFERITYKYMYIRKTKILIASVDFGGSYVGIESSQPTCVEQ